MAFDLDAPDHELAYWDALPLSSEAKQRIQVFLAEVSDEFRLAPHNRLGSDSPYFKIEYIILDLWGDRRMHRVDFFIRDDKAEFGVLFIAYLELLQ